MNTPLVRTTVRLEPGLKKSLELKAVELNVTFQDLFNQALKIYLRQASRQKAKRLVFAAQDLGVPLDRLTREDLYAD